jgi:transposase
MTGVRVIGLDIAKSVFQLHSIDAAGAIVLQRPLTPARLLPFFEKLSPCLIGKTHMPRHTFWARGHWVNLMPPQYVSLT